MYTLTSLLAAFKLDPMNWEVIKPSLNFLWQGLLAIFVVIGLIILAVKLTSFIISKCTEAKKKREEKAKNESENNS